MVEDIAHISKSMREGRPTVLASYIVWDNPGSSGIYQELGKRGLVGHHGLPTHVYSSHTDIPIIRRNTGWSG